MQEELKVRCILELPRKLVQDTEDHCHRIRSEYLHFIQSFQVTDTHPSLRTSKLTYVPNLVQFLA